MDFLIEGFAALTWQQVVMFVVGAVLIFLAISKKLEPALLLPIGFGAILVNIPMSGAVDQVLAGVGPVQGIIDWLFSVGISASEAMPLLLFIGIGAMIDFGPLLKNPKLLFFGAAAQFGIFITILAATGMGFSLT
ncbi:MAG: sodium ion-translocating decarboxylase subunit beta, partial [Christensenella sp.]